MERHFDPDLSCLQMPPTAPGKQVSELQGCRSFQGEAVGTWVCFIGDGVGIRAHTACLLQPRVKREQETPACSPLGTGAGALVMPLSEMAPEESGQDLLRTG